MHNLVSDLAQWVSGETCFSFDDASEANKQQSSLEKVRHYSYVCDDYDGKSKLDVFSKVEQLERLRTFLPLSNEYDMLNPCYMPHMVRFDWLPKFKKLRVLNLKRYYVTELPESFGHLRYLRYLNLSGTKIRSLPNQHVLCATCRF